MNDDRGVSVRQTSDGGYILAGYSRSFGSGQGDVWLIKADEDGDELWNVTHGGSSDDYFFSVQQTGDGGHIAAGYSSSYGNSGEDFYVVKTEPDEPAVATAVRSFASYWAGDHVEIECRLSDIADFLTFEVYRREEPGGSFSRIEASEIRRDHDCFVFYDFAVRLGRTYTYRVIINEDGDATASFETTASGVYVCRLTAGKRALVRKVVLLR